MKIRLNLIYYLCELNMHLQRVNKVNTCSLSANGLFTLDLFNRQHLSRRKSNIYAFLSTLMMYDPVFLLSINKF
jgi:hypothetical protein